MAKGSDNPFPSLLIVEQGSTPASPSSGQDRLFVRTSDHVFCLVNSSGTVTALSGSLTNPMTTGGDVIYGGGSGVPTRLANGSAGQALTSAGGTSAPTWASPWWTTDISESGASLTNWTQESGSWSVVSSSFQVTTPASTANRLKLTAQHRQAGLIFQAQCSMVTGGGFSGIRWMGLLIGWAGSSTGGIFAGLKSTAGSPSSDGLVYAEPNQGVNAATAIANNFSLDTFYNVSIVAHGSLFDVYIDGTYKGSFGGGTTPTDTVYLAVLARNCIAQFKNIKSSYLSVPTLPL